MLFADVDGPRTHFSTLLADADRPRIQYLRTRNSADSEFQDPHTTDRRRAPKYLLRWLSNKGNHDDNIYRRRGLHSSNRGTAAVRVQLFHFTNTEQHKRPPTLKPSQPTWAVTCYHPHPPSPFNYAIQKLELVLSSHAVYHSGYFRINVANYSHI